MDGIAAVQARIQQIMSQFGDVSAGGVLGTSDSGTTPMGTSANDNTSSFAAALAQAQGTPAATASDGSVPTSSGKLNRAGVDSIGWARDFLTKLNMPITSENVRAISAWEQAEGTKASFNPLATTQGGFAGETRFNSVGVKNYATYQDGINANAHALMNGRYTNILDALRAGNSATAVAQAIADSPWGTHGGVLRVLASQGA
jgi:predicted membrane metal-binding protein